MKNTMRHALADIIAPHYCCRCGTIGSLLCDLCFHELTDEIVFHCPMCKQPHMSGHCQTCTAPYDAAWCALERSGAIETLINRYKFERTQSAAQPLARLLHATTPSLPPDTIIVPIPTIAAHVRQRGYDHCVLLAKQFATHRQLIYTNLLRRNHESIQRGATRQQRLDQMKHAFRCTQPLSVKHTYCIIDDVATTGATISAATHALHRAGARSVIAAIVAYQPVS
mgnify:CR=1 FL=1